MHVIFRESFGLEDTATPYDLGQDPADLLILSFSDSDLGAFMAGYQRALGRTDGGRAHGGGAQGGRADARAQASLPSTRLAHLAALKHPVSIDTYFEKTACHAKGILVRLIGGEAYWSYGLTKLFELAQKHQIALAVLPADGRSDPRLEALSTVPRSTLDRLKHLCDIGGAIAAEAALAQLALAAGLYAPPVLGKKTIPDFGFYDPATYHDGEFGFSDEVPPHFIPVLFYRSYVTASDLHPIDSLISHLRGRGFASIGIFVPSLKQPEARAWLAAQFTRLKPKALINLTAFSAQSEAQSNGQSGEDPLHPRTPIFQLALSTARKKEWHASDRGLSPQDLAMYVALPEIDGRIFAGVASFKSPRPRDADLQYARFAHRGDDIQITRILDKITAWVNLSQTPNKDKRIALILSTYPGKPYQMAHAVGCDALASAQEILRILRSENYHVSPIDSLATKLKSAQLSISITEYKKYFSALPSSMQAQIFDMWGAIEADPHVRDGHIYLSALQHQNSLIALQPERGLKGDRTTLYHDLARVPCHSYIAFYFAMQAHNIDALIHIGAHGTLEWLPGKSVALSPTCWPEMLIGSIPVIYPFIVNDPGEAAMAKRRVNAVTLGHLPPPLAPTQRADALIGLEHLLDEYSTADGLDPHRRDRLVEDIRQAARSAGVDKNLGLTASTQASDALLRIDRFVCDIKESQYAQGLHIFGQGTHGVDERAGLLAALSGKFVPPGPSGSPFRGREDVLPTGRNLFTIDPRKTPSASAHAQGIKLADELLRRHLQDHGQYPREYIVDLWGSATMRTAGEEFSMALHLAGLKPLWDEGSGRVAHFEIIPLALLARPRIGVVLRLSGLFRDIFPDLAQLFARGCTALHARVHQNIEPPDMNPYGDKAARIFMPRPQNYGIALDDQPRHYDEATRRDAGTAWLHASEWAIDHIGDHVGDQGGDNTGSIQRNRQGIEQRVQEAEGFVHIQDLRESDILLASDYASHQAGIMAARTLVSDAPLPNYHIDHSQAGTPKVRGLSEEIARVVYARASHSGWINSMMAHGFRGGAELAATLDHMAQFAHLADAVSPELFDRYYEATLGQKTVYDFLEQHNLEALHAMQARFYALMQQGLWQSRKNSIRAEVLDQKQGCGL